MNTLKLLTVTLIFCSCRDQFILNCPPKYVVYRNINKVFPTVTKDFHVQIGNALSATNGLKDSAGISIQQNVVKLHDDLDNISSRIEILTKANLLYYYGGICDPNVRKGYEAFQNRLADVTMTVTNVNTTLGSSRGPAVPLDDKVKSALSLTERLKTSLTADSIPARK